MKKLLLAAWVLLPAAARAADGPEIFAGYALSRRNDDAYHGIRAGLDVRIGGPLGLELAGGAQRWDGGVYTLTDLTLMLGPRISGRGRIAPFAAFMAGLVRTNQHNDNGFTSHYSEQVAALDAGVDVARGSRWAVRAQAGLQFTQDGFTGFDAPSDAWEASPRGSIAVVWRPGR